MEKCTEFNSFFLEFLLLQYCKLSFNILNQIFLHNAVFKYLTDLQAIYYMKQHCKTITTNSIQFINKLEGKIGKVVELSGCTHTMKQRVTIRLCFGFICVSPQHYLHQHR